MCTCLRFRFISAPDYVVFIVCTALFYPQLLFIVCCLAFSIHICLFTHGAILLEIESASLSEAEGDDCRCMCDGMHVLLTLCLLTAPSQYVGSGRDVSDVRETDLPSASQDVSTVSLCRLMSLFWFVSLDHRLVVVQSEWVSVSVGLQSLRKVDTMYLRSDAAVCL